MASIDQYREGYERGQADNLAGNVVASILNRGIQTTTEAIQTAQMIVRSIPVPTMIN